MASDETKLVSRIVLRAAVFISLSVLVSAEGRRCYWCGPLAEQVHRSQRAPSCGDTNTHVTVCDPGFPYCAAVATSPPYVESRYCVKFYQDECYSLYCNSTKTWRMTCPCRGDLCNGPNTVREHEAFAVLTRLVSRTNNARIKRALISTPGFITGYDIKNATAIETIMNTEENATVTAAVEIVTNALIDPIAKNHSNDGMQSDEPAEHIDVNDSKNKTTMTTDDLSKPTMESIKDGNNVNEAKTVSQTPTKEMTPQMVDKDTVPTIPTRPGKDVIKLADKVKQSNPLSTSETHQHDQKTADKLNGKTVTPTMNSRNNGITTETSMRANNTASQIDTHLMAVAIGIILQY